MKQALAFLTIAGFATQAHAGNVMEMATRSMSGDELDRMTFYTEGNVSRMDQAGRDGRFSVIFKDAEFIYLDHGEQIYLVMDEAMLQGIASQISEAMKEMEEQLAAMPPAQRAMVEQMMKEQMGGATPSQVVANIEIREIGSDRYEDYDCTLAEMIEDGVKVQEICSVDFADVDGSGDVRDSFIKMGELLNELYNAIPFAGQGARNPMEILDDLDGFPVRAVEFEDGQAVRETVLLSTGEQPVDSAMFSVPAGYSRIDPMAP